MGSDYQRIFAAFAERNGHRFVESKDALATSQQFVDVCLCFDLIDVQVFPGVIRLSPPDPGSQSDIC